jgi:hypothetical protein
MKNAAFWDVTLCGSCKTRRFGGLIASIMRAESISELGTTVAVNNNSSTLRSINHFMRKGTIYFNSDEGG